MNLADTETLLANAAATALGDRATYMPKVGPVRALTLFVRRRQQVIDGLGAASILTDGQVLEVRRSALTIDPQPGDQVLLGDQHLEVRSAKPAGGTGTLWHLDCVPAEPE